MFIVYSMGLQQSTDDLTPKRRELFLRIWAGFTPVHDITARLYYLACHFPADKLDAALYWLLKNKLTGKRFVEFALGECVGSNLVLHSTLLAKLDHEKKLKAVYAGKDFRV